MQQVDGASANILLYNNMSNVCLYCSKYASFERRFLINEKIRYAILLIGRYFLNIGIFNSTV